MPTIKDRNKIEDKLNKEYSAGFVTIVESETFEPGINEEIVTRLSKIKKEPQWLLDFRLKSYKRWLEMEEPNWSTLNIDPIDYQSISYYSAPKKGPASYDDVEITISTWKTKADVMEWANHPIHIEAKQKSNQWYHWVKGIHVETVDG